MAISHSTTVRNDIAARVLADVDAQSSAGKIKIKDVNNVVLGTFLLGATPGTKPSGTVSGATLTFATITNVSCLVAGTAAKFDVTDGSNNVIYSGTITAIGGGGDMTFTNLIFNIGDIMSLTSVIYNSPV